VIIRAGVRDLSKANKRFPNVDSKRLSFGVSEVKEVKSGQSSSPSLSLTGDKAKDVSELKGFDTLILIPPQEYHNRFDVVKAYVDTAKAAGVKHIVVCVCSALHHSIPHSFIGSNH